MRKHISSLVQLLSALPLCLVASAAQGQADWLIDGGDFKAKLVYGQSAKEAPVDRWHLENGLVRRSWAMDLSPTCIALDNLITGESLLRAVNPEARLIIDGESISLGGMAGQPNRAFLLDSWVDRLQPDPAAWSLVSADSGPEISPRLDWNRVRHCAPGVRILPPPPSCTAVQGVAQLRKWFQPHAFRATAPPSSSSSIAANQLAGPSTLKRQNAH